MSPYPVYKNKPIDQWKVTELKDELRKRKLKMNGLKDDLVRRLDEALRNEMTPAAGEEADNATDPDFGSQDNVDQNDSEKNTKQPAAETTTEHTEDQSGNIATAAIADVDDNTLDVNQGTGHVQNETCDTTKDVAVEGTSDDAFPVKSSTDDQKETGDTTMNVEVEVTSEDAVPVNSTTNDQKETVDTTTNVAVEDASEDVPVKFVADDQKETGDTTISVAVEDASNSVVSMNSVAVDQNTVTNSVYDNQGAIDYEKTKDSKPHSGDPKPTLSEFANQVSEVSQDLGCKVKYESFSTDSVSINEKNELKDNLNANNVNLELEVKREVVQPSSADAPTAGVDLQPLDGDKDLVSNQVPLTDIADVTCTEDVQLSTKNDSVDGGSSEKLNLDRSSGDESMEEDVLESKQIESKNNSDEVKEMDEDKEVEVVQVVNPVDVVGGFAANENKVSEDRTKCTAPVEKRKAEEQETIAVNEPKRQRRWNSENTKAPAQQTANTAAATPKVIFQPSFKRSFSRNDSTVSDETPKERIVPPSKKDATASLRIDNFLRPFTLKAVHELLAKTGTFSDFWMDHIKTHCYVTYSSVEEAIATRNALFNLQWPINGGRLLAAEFVDPQEVKSHLEAPKSSTPILPTPKTPTAARANVVPTPQHQLKREQLPPPPPLPPPPARERLPPPPPLKKPDPPIVTLDDLFRKTEAIPRIYYLPLSDEQVAAKLAAQGKRAQEGQ